MSRKILFPAISLFILFHSCSQDQTNPYPDPDLFSVEACLSQTQAATFDIMTWNTREFPLQGEITIRFMADIISGENPDLIALQEITSEEDLRDLTENLPGWEAVMTAVTDLNPAILYKSSEVKLIGSATYLFPENQEAFPRSPLLISVEHVSGLRVFIINIHLKCCSGEVNELRRLRAGEILKEYMDDKLSMEKVIVLGDFNDEIIPLDGTPPVFSNFISDSLNYAFTDMEIATGDPFYWSFPGWPSHIDHILITNELFDAHLSTQTLTYDLCDPSYLIKISDHRPLMIRFN